MNDERLKQIEVYAEKCQDRWAGDRLAELTAEVRRLRELAGKGTRCIFHEPPHCCCPNCLKARGVGVVYP